MAKKHDPRHLSFVREYFYGEDKGNAEKCGIRAGYSERYSHTFSWSWVGDDRNKSRNKTLWDLVQAEREKIGEKWGITEQWVMDGYIRDEEFDPIHLVDPETGLPETDLRKIPKPARMSLKGLKVRQQVLKTNNEDGEGGESQVIKQTCEFQYPDKKGNRDSMAKILGLLRDRKEHTGKGGGPIEVRYQDVAGEEQAERLIDMGDRLIEELNKRS